MKTFILLTKLSPEVSKKVSERASIGHLWFEEVKEKCPEVKFISHYAILGEFDFLDIYEAPDEETATKVSLISRKHGAFEARSLTAIPYKKFIKISEDL